jgi:hypothetical protein
VSPDSVYGYGFAISGTLLLLLVGVGYALRKRLRRNWAGLLHTVLTWHVAGGMLGLALILMHAAGNFHPRSGTYALYALIALVVSGIVGRILDHYSPRFAASAALDALTPDGEERLEVLVGTLDAKQRRRHTSHQKSAEQSSPAGTLWDLAYYGLDVDPSEIPSLLHQETLQRANDIRSPIHPGLAAGNVTHETKSVQYAIGKERFYLQLVRVWRRLHTLISLVALALILWHLEFAATLLMQAR